MRKTIILAASAAIALAAHADHKIQHWRVSAPINVTTPFLNDTINPEGKGFKATDLLKNRTRARVSGAVVATDTTGVVSLPTSGNSLTLLQTRVRSERFGKPTLRVTSRVPFVVNIDGKEIISKQSVERDSLTGASTSTAQLRLEPEHDVELTIKALVMESDSVATPTIAVAIDGDGSYADGPDLLRRFALDDTQYGNRVSGLSMSPDGKLLIVRYYNYYSADRQRAYSTLVDLTSGRELRSGLPGGVHWMPSGDKLYYTTTAADGFDLYRLDPRTGTESLMAESIPTDRFTMSPNGDYLIYTDYTEGVKEQGPLRRYASPDDRIPGNRGRSFLVQFDPTTGMTRPLTYGNHSTSLLDISTDGKTLLVMTSSENPQRRPFYDQTVYTLDLATLKADTLVAPSPAFLAGAAFSPDGKSVAFTGSPSAFNELGKNCGSHPIANDYDEQLYILNIADKSVRALSRDFNPNIEQIICWNKADGLIYLKAEEGFGSSLWTLNPSTGTYNRLPQEVAVVNGVSMGDDAATHLAYFGQDYQYSGRAYVLDLKKGKTTLLADPGAGNMAEINLGKAEPWRFTASDGTEIDGIMMLPPDFDPNKKYPLIVYYYGGTSPTLRTITQPYTPQLFASRDYVVYVINPSGTTGYGQEFSARHVNAWGKRTAEDIIEGVEQFCKAHPFVDSSKIGCLGASYGGFMTQYLQTQTPMFAAAVSHAGISNVTSYWGEGYWGYSYNSKAAADSYPWSDPELFTRQGSLFNADKINTPLLLLHGTADTNVPIGESIQLFNALRILGKDVEFVSVDGENHFIADYPKRILWQNTIMAWFERWLKDDASWWNDLYPERNL